MCVHIIRYIINLLYDLCVLRCLSNVLFCRAELIASNDLSDAALLEGESLELLDRRLKMIFTAHNVSETGELGEKIIYLFQMTAYICIYVLFICVMCISLFNYMNRCESILQEHSITRFQPN